MATKPHIRTYTNSSIETLNAIRNSASTSYKDYIPVATSDPETIRQIGKTLMDMPQLQNEFLTSLVNRIAKVIVTSKLYDNPLARFKKGILDYGEVVEEVFINIAKVYEYDPVVAESELYKRVLPDVRSAFHVMNFQKFYKTTTQEMDFRQAFLSADGVTNFIMKITESLWNAANYDEFLVTKYLLMRRILQGEIKVVTISNENSQNGAMQRVEQIKTISNRLVFPSSEFNRANVVTKSEKNEQYILVDAKFEAEMGVEVLASAFHMEKVEFVGHEIMIDSFGELDRDRLDSIFANDATYERITDDDLVQLANVKAVIVDADYFQIYDKLLQYKTKENEQGLYYNYFLHCWKIFSVSPFANAVVFSTSGNAITKIEIPATLELTTTDVEGATYTFTPVITPSNSMYSHEILWEFVNIATGSQPTWESDGYEITSAGTLRVKAGVSGGGTVRATLKSDSSITADCVLTITRENTVSP